MEIPLVQIKVDDNIELRMIDEQDAQVLFELVDQNRAYLHQWLPWVDSVQSIEDELTFIRHTREQYADKSGFARAIWYKGQLAGTIGYHAIDWTNRKVEIGYLLGASFQGKGLMTTACRTLVGYAFDTLHLNKVQIRCASGNKRSCAIPQRLGFKEEGVLREHEWLYDHFVDLVSYGVLASEWGSTQY